MAIFHSPVSLPKGTSCILYMHSIIVITSSTLVFQNGKVKSYKVVPQFGTPPVRNRQVGKHNFNFTKVYDTYVKLVNGG